MQIRWQIKGKKRTAWYETDVSMAIWIIDRLAAGKHVRPSQL